MPRHEETPLLLLFLEDSASSAYRKQSFGNNRNNSRYNRINEGATSVLTQWPAGQITTCCMAGLLFLVFFMTFVVILLAASFHPSQFPYCLGEKFTENSTRIYLVHHGKWQQNQFNAIYEIAKHYEDVPIELIDLWNSTQRFHKHLPRTNLTHKKEIIRRKQLQAKNKEVYIQIDMDWPISKANATPEAFPLNSSQSQLYQPKIKNLKHLLKMYPVIIYNQETMNNFFAMTPLYAVWKLFDIEVVEFAARVLRLWENAGISLKLPENPPDVKFSNGQTQFEQWRMDALLRSNLSNFVNLTEGMVNIDNEIFRMETKTPCHAFFGELLANLRRSTPGIFVDDILTATLKTFCENGDVNDSFCSNYFLLE